MEQVLFASDSKILGFLSYPTMYEMVHNFIHSAMLKVQLSIQLTFESPKGCHFVFCSQKEKNDLGHYSHFLFKFNIWKALQDIWGMDNW